MFDRIFNKVNKIILNSHNTFIKKAIVSSQYIFKGYTMLNEKDFINLISASIRKRRLSKKISSEKLSELSDMDYSSINLIENQKQNPRAYTLYKLLYSLDIDITKELKSSTIQSNSKDEIIQKLNLMTDTQIESLLKLINNFEITAK